MLTIKTGFAIIKTVKEAITQTQGKERYKKMTNYNEIAIDIQDTIAEEAIDQMKKGTIVPDRAIFEAVANEWDVTITDEDWKEILIEWTDSLDWEETKKFMKKMNLKNWEEFCIWHDGYYDEEFHGKEED